MKTYNISKKKNIDLLLSVVYGLVDASPNPQSTMFFHVRDKLGPSYCAAGACIYAATGQHKVQGIDDATVQAMIQALFFALPRKFRDHPPIMIFTGYDFKRKREQIVYQYNDCSTRDERLNWIMEAIYRAEEYSW